MFDINETIFLLESNLVNMSKYENKIYFMTEWFNTYNNLKAFIVQHGVKTTQPKVDINIDTLIDNKETVGEFKVIQFSHLL